MTELQSALLLRRQLAGERWGAGPRSQADEPLASPRPLGGREGGSPWVSAGRPATLLARLRRVLGAGTRPSLALGRAGRPGRLPPPPWSWGVAGEGRGSRPGRPSPRGGSRAQVRRRPRDLRDPGERAGPAPLRVRVPERGGAPNFWPGGAGSAELGRTTKATAGWPGCWRGAPRARRSARLRFACLRLARTRGCAARLGEGGRGCRGEPLAGRPGLCARRGSCSRAGPQPQGCGPPQVLARAAAECLPRGVSVPLPHCPGLRPFAASRLTF